MIALKFGNCNSLVDYAKSRLIQTKFANKGAQLNYLCEDECL